MSNSSANKREVGLRGDPPKPEPKKKPFLVPDRRRREDRVIPEPSRKKVARSDSVPLPQQIPNEVKQ